MINTVAAVFLAAVALASHAQETGAHAVCPHAGGDPVLGMQLLLSAHSDARIVLAATRTSTFGENEGVQLVSVRDQFALVYYPFDDTFWAAISSTETPGGPTGFGVSPRYEPEEWTISAELANELLAVWKGAITGTPEGSGLYLDGVAYSLALPKGECAYRAKAIHEQANSRAGGVVEALFMTFQTPSMERHRDGERRIRSLITQYKAVRE